MVRIALDPTPYNDSVRLIDMPDLVARLGYRHLQLTPSPDLGRHFHHPKLDTALIAQLRRRASDAGVEITSVLPVQRLGGPEPEQVDRAVFHMTRYIRIAAELGAPVINTEFSGRPERAEESEHAFYRAMERLLPVLETEGVTMNIDPHPDDFVEDALEAWRIIRGLDSDRVGFVYVASHTFHYGDRAATLLPEIGDRLGAVYVADTLDHRRSHGLRYITNPPGNAVRVHQHLRIGDGDVDWSELFGTLRRTGYLDRPDALIVSNVFAEDERADEVSRSQLARVRELVADGGTAA